jgi:hypothetical protein
VCCTVAGILAAWDEGATTGTDMKKRNIRASV